MRSAKNADVITFCHKNYFFSEKSQKPTLGLIMHVFASAAFHGIKSLLKWISNLVRLFLYAKAKFLAIWKVWNVAMLFNFLTKTVFSVKRQKNLHLAQLCIYTLRPQLVAQHQVWHGVVLHIWSRDFGVKNLWIIPGLRLGRSRTKKRLKMLFLARFLTLMSRSQLHSRPKLKTTRNYCFQEVIYGKNDQN